MASIKVCVTTDYNKFELLPFNRNVRKTKRLMESMQKHGFINAYPLHVVMNGNGKLKIKAGHHRFEVARMLGLPVKYIECNDTATIYELERATNRWSLEDYLTSHARQGIGSYVKVLEFHQRTGIGINDTISMLGGQTAGSNNFQNVFKAGAYEAADGTHAYIVADIVMHCKKLGIAFATNYLFVHALSRIVQVEGFDVRRLKHKIETFSYLMEKQPTLVAYEDMIERVYNRQAKETIPLAFLAAQAAKERSAVKQ